MKEYVLGFCLIIGCMGCAEVAEKPLALSEADQEAWVQLFNGTDLDDWDIKIRGYELNDNYENTFRVTDGVIQVGYEGYETFDDRFGHIFYREPFSYYTIAVEYRFVGE